ncbi:MAG: hypothetical protein IJ127_24200 [Afipia sp.]|nr:hypothetical protein [Afipia sp.]
MASRGVKKPKLRDLSIDPLTLVEANSLLDSLDASLPPIALAILGQVLLEHELESSLRQRLLRRDDKTWAAMLEERGPLGTFSRKIAAAHALKIIEDAEKTNMDIIRVVRNAFAHSKRLINFEHPLVVAELNKLAIPSYRKRHFQQLKTNGDKKHVYLMMCMTLTLRLVKRYNEAQKKATRRKSKKLITSPLYRQLAPSLGLAGMFSPTDLRLSQLGTLADLSERPTPPTQQGLLGGLFGLGQEALRTQGKKK